MTTTSQEKRQPTVTEILQEQANRIRVLESQLAIVSSQRDAAMTKVSELAATVNILAQDFDSLRKATENLKEEATKEIERLTKANEAKAEAPSDNIADME